ncbi:MAG: lysylphosphatidylglycerol synthase transmembrane domain-containing protein [Acidimicrobiales bacterium]
MEEQPLAAEPALGRQPTAVPTRRSWRSLVPAPLRHSAVIFVLLLLLEYVVAPELVGASRHLYLLTHIRIGWVVAGFLFEAASLAAYGLLSRSLLPGTRPSYSTIIRIDLSGLAVSHVLPGGSAGSAGLGYRLLTRNGVNGADAAFAMATQGIGSAVVLNALLWCSLVISIPIAGFHPIYVVVALVGMLVLLVVGALVYSLTHGEDGAIRFARALGHRVPRLDPDRVELLVRRLGTSLRDLATDRGLLRRALRWAVLNWLLDAASLWSFVAALGIYVNPFELFAAYGIANVLAVIPVTPGGLGLIDAAAPALLVSFGVTRSPATLAVLAWRLVNFWIPIPVGAAAYVSLRVPRGSSLGARSRALRDMATEATPADPTVPIPVTTAPVEPIDGSQRGTRKNPPSGAPGGRPGGPRRRQDRPAPPARSGS